MAKLLGVDTGGTFTDAVVFDDVSGAVIARAKSLTTHHDLARGVAAAMDEAIRAAGAAPGDIALASMSTTLATNALVEGHGDAAGLIMIGFSEADLARAGLGEALGADPAVFIAGGHNSAGGEAAPAGGSAGGGFGHVVSSQ